MFAVRFYFNMYVFFLWFSLNSRNDGQTAHMAGPELVRFPSVSPSPPTLSLAVLTALVEPLWEGWGNR